MLYGYCRISKAKQSIDRQIRNIKAAYPEAFIVQEVFTRTRLDSPEWQKLLKKIHAGDTIVFDSVSRMSGNAIDGFAAYEELYNKGINLISHHFLFLIRAQYSLSSQVTSFLLLH